MRRIVLLKNKLNIILIVVFLFCIVFNYTKILPFNLSINNLFSVVSPVDINIINKHKSFFKTADLF